MNVSSELSVSARGISAFHSVLICTYLPFLEVKPASTFPVDLLISLRVRAHNAKTF